MVHTPVSIAVAKSLPEFVGPSEPMALTGNIQLSAFDRAVVSMPVTSLHVFERPIHQPARTIRRALSKALVPYHPIAGRLAVPPPDGALQIASTGEGVIFVAAEANCTLDDVKYFDLPLVMPLDDLSVRNAGGSCGQEEPLLSMQVTEFTCGGFVVGVTWNHVIADGEGLAQFLQAVVELAHGLQSTSIVPFRYESTLADILLSVSAVEQSMATFVPGNFAYSDITIPSSFIMRVKSEFRRHTGGQVCSMFEVVAAVVWQCRTRAIISDPAAPTALLFGVNMREHFRIKDGYYGNCATLQPVVATCGAVANGDVKDLVKLIKEAKALVQNKFENRAQNCTVGGTGNEQLGLVPGYNVLFMSCWRNLGFDKVDFGSGGPARVMCNLGRPAGAQACVVCPPCGRKDGANVISAFVNEEHVDGFLAEVSNVTIAEETKLNTYITDGS